MGILYLFILNIDKQFRTKCAEELRKFKGFAADFHLEIAKCERELRMWSVKDIGSKVHLFLAKQELDFSNATKEFSSSLKRLLKSYNLETNNEVNHIVGMDQSDVDEMNCSAILSDDIPKTIINLEVEGARENTNAMNKLPTDNIPTTLDNENVEQNSNQADNKKDENLKTDLLTDKSKKHWLRDFSCSSGGESDLSDVESNPKKKPKWQQRRQANSDIADDEASDDLNIHDSNIDNGIEIKNEPVIQSQHLNEQSTKQMEEKRVDDDLRKSAQENMEPEEEFYGFDADTHNGSLLEIDFKNELLSQTTVIEKNIENETSKDSTVSNVLSDEGEVLVSTTTTPLGENYHNTNLNATQDIDFDNSNNSDLTEQANNKNDEQAKSDFYDAPTQIFHESDFNGALPDKLLESDDCKSKVGNEIDEKESGDELLNIKQKEEILTKQQIEGNKVNGEVKEKDQEKIEDESEDDELDDDIYIDGEDVEDDEAGEDDEDTDDQNEKEIEK